MSFSKCVYFSCHYKKGNKTPYQKVHSLASKPKKVPQKQHFKHNSSTGSWQASGFKNWMKGIHCWIPHSLTRLVSQLAFKYVVIVTHLISWILKKVQSHLHAVAITCYYVPHRSGLFIFKTIKWLVQCNKRILKSSQIYWQLLILYIRPVDFEMIVGVFAELTPLPRKKNLI